MWRPSSGQGPAPGRSARSSGPGDRGSHGSWRTSRNRSPPAPPSGAGVAARAADVARMSWPRRSKRPAVRTMSSCNGVPTIWAIKPIRTAGCAIKTSCNGDPAAVAVPTSRLPTGCAIERSCNAVPTRRALRQYPGWRDRHAWTRATFTGPRKYPWFSGAASQRAWLAALLAARHAAAEQ